MDQIENQTQQLNKNQVNLLGEFGATTKYVMDKYICR
jgi:hypothetical protein